MNIVRRLCASALTTVIVGALLAVPGPAAADTREVFAGTATARALHLTVFGSAPLTLGSSNAFANSTPAAKANGAGVLLFPGTASSAEVNGPNLSQAPPEACDPINLPGIISLSLACSRSSASTTNGAPTASSGATVAAIDVGVLQLLLDVLKPVTDTVTPTVDPLLGSVLGGLQPLVGNTLNSLLPGLGLDLNSPVSSLLAGLEDVTNLAQVRLGNSTSQVATTAGKVTAVGSAQGGQVDVLPGLTTGGGPLLSVVIGSATATSEYDRGTGKSTPSFDPAILTLRALGITVPVAFGSPVVLFKDTVLESTIALGAGRAVQNPDGTVGSVADGVKLELLKGLNGGIVLELAHAESAAGGALATVTAKAPPPPAPRRELARTGDQGPWLPIGAGVLLLAFLTRRAARARR